MNHKSAWLLEKRGMLLKYAGDLDKAEILQLNEDLENFFTEIFSTQFKLNIRSAKIVEEVLETLKKLDFSPRESA